LKPDFGPVFPRDAWKKEFLRRSDGKMYLLYYGASALGKSIAVTDALSGRKGVICSRLHNEKNVTEYFNRSIGFTGNFWC
jgi:hypothetical protein